MIECLDQVGMLLLSDLSCQECTTYRSQQGFDVPDSPTGQGEEKRFSQTTNTDGDRSPDVSDTRSHCFQSTRRDHKLFAPQECAEETDNVSRTSPSARLDQTKDAALLEVLRQEFALLRVRGQRLVLGRV